MSITIEKNGYKLTHKPYTRFNANGWEYEAFKPDGTVLLCGTTTSDDNNADAIKELDRAIEFHNRAQETDRVREAAPWVKHKRSGCETKVYPVPMFGSPDYHCYTIRKDGVELCWGNSHKGAAVALTNAKNMIKNHNY